MTSPSPSTEHSNPAARVAVVGSANHDTTVHVRSAPRPGETVRAITQTSDVGGKGVNQAVAGARAGATVQFIGSVGLDAAGSQIEQRLAAEGIDTAMLDRVDAPTGAAFITVAADGENSIILSGGANDVWTRDDDQLGRAIGLAEIVVTQAEIPQSVQRRIAGIARTQNVPVMFTAAPVANVALDTLPLATYVLVNEEEALQLSGEGSVREAAITLSLRIERSGWCIVTRGAREILAAKDGRIEFEVMPRQVESPVDTTGAGDTFAGWCAARLAEGVPIDEAVREASRAAAISVTRAGASSSIPHRRDVLTDEGGS